MIVLAALISRRIALRRARARARAVATAAVAAGADAATAQAVYIAALPEAMRARAQAAAAAVSAAGGDAAAVEFALREAMPAYEVPRLAILMFIVLPWVVFFFLPVRRYADLLVRAVTGGLKYAEQGAPVHIFNATCVGGAVCTSPAPLLRGSLP